MNNHEPTVTLWVCTDCIMLFANGETPPDLSEIDTKGATT